MLSERRSMEKLGGVVPKIRHQHLPHSAVGAPIDNYPSEIATKSRMHIAAPVRAQRLIVTIIPCPQIHLKTNKILFLLPAQVVTYI